MGIENPVHLLFIAAVALLVLGPRRLPELARSLGRGIREFREAMGEGSSSSAPAPLSTPPPTPAPDPPAQVDPPEPVRSGDAPDRRPL
jgi:sec-independent protein translocase protein TatA